MEYSAGSQVVLLCHSAMFTYNHLLAGTEDKVDVWVGYTDYHCHLPLVVITEMSTILLLTLVKLQPARLLSSLVGGTTDFPALYWVVGGGGQDRWTNG